MRDWPLGGDLYLIKDIFDVVNTFNIKVIVETGTWKGRSAQLFSAMVDNVYTIEINEDFYNQADYLSEYINIHRYLGNSYDVLFDILNYKEIGENILYFLDAHWRDEWPLKKELQTIADFGSNNSIICIHDIFNPNNEELGYDRYSGQRLDFEYIKPEVESIFGKNYSLRYNKNATGEKRGVLFIKKSWV